MYIKYSTRRFKIDHLDRIRALKKRYLSQGVDRTQEQILVQVVEEGLKIVEAHIFKLSFQFELGMSDEKVLHQLYVDSKRKRVAPMGIRDEEPT